ncbi:membrane protein [Echinicola pacifica]|uniref:Membrane protein n=1 Tax=Echinicola pacifica TaxID=346377 RepID=A0A918PW30_9BACT|nr:TolC family protein [Echinicola pacifica]GGZ22852.1 membrane protein [Echinicola pacifica]
MIKQYLAILGCMIGAASASAQETLTFEQAVTMGLENNYDIKIALQDKEITEIDKKLGLGPLLPSLDATYGRTTSTEDVEQQFVSENEPRNINGAKSTGENFNINGIYGFRYDAVVALRRLGEQSEIGELQAKVAIENTVASIANAYYRLSVELDRYEVLKETVALSQQRLDIEQAQYELGGSSKSQYLAAEVDFNADRSQLVSQEQVIQTARINLNELLAVDAEINYAIQDTVLINPDITLPPLLEDAFGQNKMLLINRREENVAYLQYKELQAQRLPYLALDGNYRQSVSNSDAGFLIQNKRQGYSFGATVGINIFSGFTLNRQIQRARVQQQTQAYTLDQYEVQLRSDLHRAYNVYENSIRRLDIEQSNYKVVEENTAIAFDRFKSGLTSYLEFRDAQVNRLNAESRLIDAVYSTKVAEVELMRLAGRIFYQTNEDPVLPGME